jgi:hypothetical protein
MPVGLIVRILETKIRDCMKEEEKWCLIQGFPEDLEQLLEFERKVCISCVFGVPNLHIQVQKNNYSVYLNCRNEGTVDMTTLSRPDFWKTRSDVKNRLESSVGYHKALFCEGSEETYNLTRKAIQQCVEHQRVWNHKFSSSSGSQEK